MKVKVSEASGIVLDWLVATAEKPVGGYKAWVQIDLDSGLVPAGVHADDWLTGGPIIEREGISVSHSIEGDWMGYYTIDFDMRDVSRGPTPLVAAMRCFVSSKLGDEVEVPDALC